MRPPELAKPLFDHRRVGQNPTVDGAMIGLEATVPGTSPQDPDS